MDKKELLEELKTKGIQAQIEEGVVMLLVDGKTYQKPASITRLIKELGYRESWGMKPTNSQLSLTPGSMTGNTN